MLRRFASIAALTAVFTTVAFVPAPQAAPVATDVATFRVDGLPPAPDRSHGDHSAFAAQSAEPHADGRMHHHAAAVVSEAVRAPIVFSMLGFQLPDGAHVDFRVSSDGQQWSQWEHAHVEPDEGPDPGAGEPGRPGTFSAPIWTGEQRYLQTRVSGASTQAVTIDLIDATGAERSAAERAVDAVRAAFTTSSAPAVAAPGRPDIVSRAEWGADEAWRGRSPSYASRVRFGVVHHTAGTNDYTQAQAKAVVRGVYKFHTWTRGWSDIGYHFLVDRFGTIYEGRYGGVDRPVIGAHAGGFNAESFGVSLMGNYASATPTTAQTDALADLLAWKFELHHIDPLGTLNRTSGGSTRYRAGTVVKLNTLSGHRDVSSTTCPASGYSLLPQLRDEIVARSGPVIATPDTSTWRVRLNREGDGDPVQISALLRPAGPWTVTVRDSEGAVVHVDSGEGPQVDVTWTPRGVERPGRFTWEITSDGRRAPSGTFDVVLDVVERVGDGDGVPAMLAGIARAAFPEDGTAGHAVIARDDVFADALGGGPLAGTDGPVLFTPPDRLEPATLAELRRTLPAGRTVYVLGGPAAITPAVADELARTWNVVRLGGADRFETAVAIAEVVRARHGGDRVMIARSGPDDMAPWADALAGGAWGASSGVPVLLTPTHRLDIRTRETVRSWGISRSIVLGGTEAVSDAVAAALPGVLRVAGSDRAGTSADIARRLWGRTSAEPGGMVTLADGYRADAWQPALAASPLVARTAAPLLLTRPDELSELTGDYLSSLGYTPDNVGGAYAIGTAWRISTAVADSVSARLQ